MIFRLQLARCSPAPAATVLVFLAACSFEPVPARPSSENEGALASAAATPELGANSDRVTANPGVSAPVLQRRADSYEDAPRNSGDRPSTNDDGDTGAHNAGDLDAHDEDGGSDHDDDLARDHGNDGDGSGSRDDDVGHQENPDDGEDRADEDHTENVDATSGNTDHNDAGDVAAAEEDELPQLSPRETMLAWLAEDSVVASFPAPTARTGAGGSVARIVLPEEPLEFVRPEAVKGIYVNAWAAGSSVRSQGLIDLASRTEVNTLVIDLKDASGYVSYPTEVMTAREAGADQEIRIRDLVGLLERVQEAGLYPIARIVIVKDPLLIRARPDWAVQDTAGGVWVDSKGLIWANLHDQRVWDYHIGLAKEAAAAGFPEIQWDYVRFADAPREDLDRASYPGAEDRLRVDAVGAFLEYAQAELEPFDVEMTIDVFGATTTASSDIGIGQLWERFIGSVDVALPMVYPSHYWPGSFGIQDPNGHPYEIVRAALRAGLARSEKVEGAGLTRPWLQDFSLGEPLYEAAEVRAQIQATYDAGVAEWVLWNPGSRYTESALEPVDGFSVDPLMRVGGRIVPVTERHVALRDAAEERALADSVAADGIAQDVDADGRPIEDDGSEAQPDSPVGAGGIRP